VEGHRDGRHDGLYVQAQAAGEGVQMREIAGPGGLGPIREVLDEPHTRELLETILAAA
jgi:hypothetical protein